MGIVHAGMGTCKVVASIEPQTQYLYNSYMRIRALTGRAAARRFIKGNLTPVLVRWDGEPDEVRRDDWDLVHYYMGVGPRDVAIQVEK